MKAKELSAKYRQLGTEMPFEQAGMEVVKLFWHDMQELLQQRGTKSVEAVNGTMREMDTRWRAFCRLETDFDPNGFERLILHCIPPIYHPFMKGVEFKLRRPVELLRD